MHGRTGLLRAYRRAQASLNNIACQGLSLTIFQRALKDRWERVDLEVWTTSAAISVQGEDIPSHGGMMSLVLIVIR